MKKLDKTAKTAFLNYGLVIVFFIVVQIMMSLGLVSNSFKGQLIPIISYVIMALALNLVVGISGELSLGHAGFMSVGAFTGVIISSALQGSIIPCGSYHGHRSIVFSPECGPSYLVK